jgi:DNA invertase Pin-like site-specific DNA recombinase
MQDGVAEEAKSVTGQIEHARAYATRKGWTVDPAHIYEDDGISGAEFARRPGLLRLMSALKPRPPFQALLITDRDRIGREQIETSYLLKQLIRAGVQVVECRGADGRVITLTSPTDKVILAVEDFAAEVERDKARQRTHDALLRRARAGHVPGGIVFGYDNVRVDGHVERRVNPTEAAVVRQIFEWAASG